MVLLMQVQVVVIWERLSFLSLESLKKILEYTKKIQNLNMMTQIKFLNQN